MGRIVSGSRGRQETPEQVQERLRQVLRPHSGGLPDEQLFETPQWFCKDANCDVSIIVPMFKSKQYIEEQIVSWDLEHDLDVEVIYVDDLCPMSSYKTVVPSWEKRGDQPVGKVVLSNIRRGYGGACNLGAKYARGKYLVFLNADVVVGKGWLRPMYDLFQEYNNVGIVGNLQIKKGTDLIDSAGSEWRDGWFRHIGRDTYNGELLTKPMSLGEVSFDLLRPIERQMVTGCCFTIPRILFEEIRGFDLGYKIGYWEDSDLNMKVHQHGLKVMLQPQSKIYHVGSHSNAAGHRWMSHNQRLFYSRWVDNGFVAQLVKDMEERNGNVC